MKLLGLVCVVMVACDGGGSSSAPDARVGGDGGDDANATLSALVVSRGELVPPFEPEITDYELALPLGDDGVDLAASAAVATTTITIDDAPVAPGAATSVALLPGTQQVLVVATAESGAQLAYRIAVRRGEPTIALSSFGPIGERLTPAFDAATHAYTASVGMWMSALEVSVVPVVAGSTITVGGGAVDAGVATPPIALNLGLTSIPVVVTDPSGAATTYTLEVTRGADVAQVAYAKASTPGEDDLFGYAVAIAGDTLVIGAPGEASAATGVDGTETDDSAPNSGAVYVFTRAGAAWTQQAYLKASNTQTGDFFGAAVAIDGDTLAVAALAEASGATGVGGNQADNTVAGAGAVYVFARTGTTWSQQAYVKSPSPDVDDNFGQALALSGDTLAIGAQSEDSGVAGDPADDSATFAGAVYVITRADGVWAAQAYLKASDVATGKFFGASLALRGDTLAVGAFGAGAVYMFGRTGDVWTEQVRLAPAVTDAGDAFGFSVALSGDRLVVGAPYEDGNGIELTDNSVSASGAVYVFTGGGATWTETAYVKPLVPDASDLFGAAVALTGDTLAIGIPGEDGGTTGFNGSFTDNTAPGAGAAYVVHWNGTQWFFSRYVKASNTNADDRFGTHLALAADTLVVGADHEDSAGTPTDNGLDASGAVYVFR